MIFSHSGADRGAARRLLLRMVICSCLLPLTADSAAAGYGRPSEILRSGEGGGTWGDILELSAAVKNSSILFTVRKKTGLPFHTESEISIKKGSCGGQSAAVGVVPVDSSSVSLNVRQSRFGAEQAYYACLRNSYGHAWVGPIKLGFFDGNEEDYHSNGPTRPRIEELPGTVQVNEHVRIRVRAGACPDGGKVRVRCFAKGSGRSNQFESEPVWPDTLLRVPFRFDQPGTQSIFCATVSRCCSSPWVSRTVSVRETPSPSVSKTSGRSETKINISVVTDADGRADSKVSVQNSRATDCAPFCGGEISYDRPYLPEAEEPSYAVPYDTPPDGTYVQPEIVPDYP